MANFDYILQAMNSYVDGVGKLGATEKCATPKIEKVMEKFRGGGMLGTRQIAMGYKEFEWEVTFNAYDPQVIRQCGLFSKKAITLSNTAALDGDAGARAWNELIDRKSTRLNSSHSGESRMPSSA